ncbi:MAG: phosphohistidine phosphatase SixA [Bacteroidota bacterium]|nr:phosphohistidine phosphatase SixA [Bacteroidota bacterium]
MMKVYFLRHGEASFSARSDAERELTDDGISSAKNTAHFCVKSKISFSAVYASPLRRAQHTAKIILEHYPSVKLHTASCLTPNAHPDDLFSELSHHTSDSRILLVTHEPFASTCIATLISGVPSCRIVMKTTSLACVEVDRTIAPGSGKLLWLLTPIMMKKLLS